MDLAIKVNSVFDRNALALKRDSTGKTREGVSIQLQLSSMPRKTQKS